jgi:hypothetical protein
MSSQNPLHIQRTAGWIPLRFTTFLSQRQLQVIRKLCEHLLQELYKGKACLQREGSQWTMWGRRGQGRKIQTKETGDYDGERNASFRASRLEHRSNVNNCICMPAFLTNIFRSLCIPAKHPLKSLCPSVLRPHAWSNSRIAKRILIKFYSFQFSYILWVYASFR